MVIETLSCSRQGLFLRKVAPRPQTMTLSNVIKKVEQGLGQKMCLINSAVYIKC